MPDDAFSGRPLPMAECSLDSAGLQSQLTRYGELSRHVDTVHRRPGVLQVDFRADVDTPLLNEAIAVERECCPFYDLTYDEPSRRLSISVKDPRHDAALDALRFALTPA